MQSTPGGSSSSGGGGGVGGGVSRVGLARFRSAPASWLEALLDDEEEDPLKPNQCLTQLLADNSPAPSSTNTVPFAPSADPGGSFEAGFARQNSSPADFLGNSSGSSETYFSNFGIPANFDLVSPNINVSSTTGSKRVREGEAQPAQHFSPKLSSQLVFLDIQFFVFCSVFFIFCFLFFFIRFYLFIYFFISRKESKLAARFQDCWIWRWKSFWRIQFHAGLEPREALLRILGALQRGSGFINYFVS